MNSVDIKVLCDSIQHTYKNNLQTMYEAIQEVFCAYVLHQEAVEKARQSKKSMLKVHQENAIDMGLAFKDCLQICEEIMGDE